MEDKIKVDVNGGKKGGKNIVMKDDRKEVRVETRKKDMDKHWVERDKKGGNVKGWGRISKCADTYSMHSN